MLLTIRKDGEYLDLTYNRFQVVYINTECIIGRRLDLLSWCVPQEQATTVKYSCPDIRHMWLRVREDPYWLYFAFGRSLIFRLESHSVCVPQLHYHTCRPHLSSSLMLPFLRHR